MATIDQTAQLNKLLKEQNKIYAAQAKIIKGQAMAVKAMVEAIKGMPLNDASDSFKQMTDSIKDAEEAVKKIGEGTSFEPMKESVSQATGLVETLKQTLEELPEGTTMAIGAITGGFNAFRTGLSLTTKILKTAVSGVGTLVSSFFNLGASIISIPFKMLNALMDEAANISGTELRQAIEDTRKEFGQLATNESKAIMQSFRGMRGSLAETGLSVRRVLGNFADRLNHLRDTAKAMGPVFSVLKDSMFGDANDAARVVAYQKGLGLTEEGMRALGERAIATGTTFQEQGRKITTMAYQMGESFGINGKLISRDVGTMMSDFENFGTLSIETMTSVATYTRRLGLEMKDLQGIIGKFDDFEDAAKAAAQLNQAFGIQIDTLGMLKDQDPASRFDKMRKAFLATGKSVEDLSRQELGLLASQTGLSEKALKLGFANRNLGYDEVQKQADKAKNNQLTQAQAMDKLAMSIERMVKSGEGHKGFWDTFLKGIARGVRWSAPFRRMLISLKRALNATFYAGIEGGRALVKLWPGLSDMFNGFGEFFRKLGNFNEKGHSRGFFKDFAVGMKQVVAGKKGIGEFFTEMQEKLENIFMGDTAKKILASVKKVFNAMGKGIAVGVDFIMPKITAGVKKLTEFITDPAAFLAGAKEQSTGFVSFFLGVFEPVYEAIKKNWPMLQKALGELVSTAWEKLKPIIIEGAKKAFKVYAKVSFWLGMWGTVRGAIMGAAAKMFASFALTGGGKSIVGKAIDGIVGNSKEVNKLGSAGTGFGEMIDAFRKIRVRDIAKMGFAMVTLGAALAGGGVAFAYGLREMANILGPIDSEKINKSLMALAVGVAGMVGVGVASKLMSTISVGDIGKAVIGLAVVAGLVTGMAYHVSLIDSMLKDVDVTRMPKLIGIISGMAILYGEAGLLLTAAGFLGVVAGGSLGIAAAAAGAGIGMMAATISTMALHAMGLVKITSGINLGEMKNTVMVVGGMAAMYAAAGLVLVESAAVGAGIMSIVGGAAMGLGFVAIKGVVTSMVENAIPLINALASVPNTSGLAEKASALGSIMDSISKLASVIVSGMKTSAGGVLDSVVSMFKGGSATKNMERGMTIMKNTLRLLMTESRQIMDYVVKLAAQVPEGDITKITAIGSIIGAVGELAKALTPQGQADGSLTGAVANMIDPTGLSRVTEHMKSIMTVIADQIPTVLDKVVVAANKIKKDKLPAIQALSGVMQAVGQLVQAIQPPPELTKAISDEGGILAKMGDWYADAIGKPKTSMLDSMFGENGYMTQMVSSLIKDGGLLDKISAFAIKVGNKIKNPEAAKLGAETLASVVKAIGNIANIQKAFPDGEIPDMSGLFQSVSTNFLRPSIIESDTMFSNFAELETKLTKKRINMVGRIGNAIQSMVDDTNKMNAELAKIDPIKIDYTLKKVGDAIAGSQSFKIERNDMTVAVNLHVSLDADEISTVLKKKGHFVNDNKPG